MNAPAERPVLIGPADFDEPTTLVYGIGNVGRQDDGLGWAFIDRLEAEGLCAHSELMRHYQLHLEDADLISDKSRVLFVDASKEESLDSFRIERVRPSMDFSFTSHAMSVPTILATCQSCFQRAPEVYILAIRGYAWELEMGLSQGAKRNLDAAFDFFTQRPRHPFQ